MSKITDDILGFDPPKADTTAIDAQRAANEETRDFLEEQKNLARKNVAQLTNYQSNLFNEGAQQAYDMTRGIMPESLNQRRMGNMAAQDMVRGGLTQSMNALMGMPVDLGFMDRELADVDISSLYQQRPPQSIENYASALTGIDDSIPGSELPEEMPEGPLPGTEEYYRRLMSGQMPHFIF